MMRYVELCQTDAADAMGISVNKFLGIKRTFPTNGQSGRKKKYQIPEEKLSAIAREKYKAVLVDSDIDPIITQIAMSTDISGSYAEYDIQEARRKKIIKETEFLDQKILAKKQELFAEWTEKFFMIFSKSFAKFKNTLIDLRLNETQLKNLNENLDFALSNMQQSLNDIKKEYIDYDDEE